MLNERFTFPENDSQSQPQRIGAFMAVLRWWADHGAKLEPLEVDAILRRLVMQVLAGK